MFLYMHGSSIDYRTRGIGNAQYLCRKNNLKINIKIKHYNRHLVCYLSPSLVANKVSNLGVHTSFCDI